MFEIIGNEAMMDRLERAVDSGALSHFYIISGPTGSGRKTLALWLAAAMECTETDVPCLKCVRCRKVINNIHPDVTVITSDKQTIGVDPIRQMRTDAYIRPNEGRRRVFIIPRAETLTVQAQNVMLKLLEEPPGTASFMLLTDNPGALLQTVRSRAVELTMARLSRQQILSRLETLYPGKSAEAQRAADNSGGLLGKAIELMENGAVDNTAAEKAGSAVSDIKKKNMIAVAALFASMEKSSKAEFEASLSALAESFAAEAAADSRFMDMADCVNRAMEFYRANVSTAHICGYLSAAVTEKM